MSCAEPPLGRARWALFAGLLLLALLVPRSWPLQGLPYTHSFAASDSTQHLMRAHQLLKVLRLSDADPADPALRRVRQSVLRDARWPPGVYIAALPWVHLFGPLSSWTPVLTNLFFLVMLVGALAGLGRAMCSTRAGLFAALFAVLSPPLVAASWYYNLDLPQVAMVFAGLLILWHTRLLRRPVPCVVLGLWTAMSFMVKPTAPALLAGPGLVALLLGLRRPERRETLIGAALAVVASAIGLWLLGPDLAAVAREAAHHTLADGSLDPHMGHPVAGAQGAAASYLQMALVELPYPLLVLGLPGILALLSPRWPRGRWLVLGCAAGSYALLLLLSARLSRYQLFAFPLLSLVTAVGTASLLRRARARSLALWGLLLAHAGLLALVHRYPTPWVDLPGRPSAIHAPAVFPIAPGLLIGLIELRLLGPTDLRELRRGKLHPACQLEPMLGPLRALIADARTRGALGVGRFACEGNCVTSPEIMGLLVSHLAPDRMVEMLDESAFAARRFAAVLRLASGTEPAPADPEFRLVASRTLAVQCAGNLPAPATFGLYERVGPAPE